MKKSKLSEYKEQSAPTFFENRLFDENLFSSNQMLMHHGETALQSESPLANEEFLDKSLSAIKLIFLYIPGALAIHFVGMFAYILIHYSETMPNFFAELSGTALVGTFLTMLGIGKLKDLNYLKVPASIFSVSVLISILYAIITIFTGSETVGYFLLISFPVVIATGYFVKRLLDNDRE